MCLPKHGLSPRLRGLRLHPVFLKLVVACALAGTGCWRMPFDQQTNDSPSDQNPTDTPKDTDRLTRPAMGFYFNDFESDVGPEWSTQARDGTPVGQRAYLGQFHNDVVSLTLHNLPAHSAVTVSFDLYVIGSWDGNSRTFGPDIWSLSTDDGQVPIETTFSNWIETRQSYPNTYPFGSHTGRTGALESDSLGYSYYDDQGIVHQWNTVYPLAATFDHQADSLVLRFAARGLEDDGTESWGLDNVSVLLTPPDGPWQTALVIEAEDFATRAIGGPVADGWNLWQTGRITDWVRFDPRCTRVRVTGVVRSDPALGRWPIMGITINQRFEAVTTASQHTWTAHTFDIDVPPGVQQVGFCFTNDEPPQQGQDRNLYANRLEIAVPADTPQDAWPVRVPIPDDLAEPTIPSTDQEVVALARDNIERDRKGDFCVRVLDASGRPVANQAVRFNMFRHHFRWGTAIRFDLDNPNSPLERTYRRELGRMFNYGTTENLLRWGYFEPQRGQPRYDDLDAYIDICNRMGISLKAHNFVWGHFDDLPRWLTDDDIAHAQERLIARIRDVMTRYAGRLAEYDVVNEPLHALQWEFWAGPSHLENALIQAAESDPAAKLLVNEYEIVAVPYMADNFLVRMQDAMNRGAPLSGVGIQLHSNIGEWYTPQEMWRAFERMSQLGVELHLTEVSLGSQDTKILGGPYDGQDWNDDLQAEYYEQVMTVAFGHPKIVSLTFWGFTDRRHFQPGSGLLDVRLKPKAAAVAYRRLLEHDWSTDVTVTTDADGRACLRGFYGWYRITHANRFAVAALEPDNTGTPDAPLDLILHPLSDVDGNNQVDDADLARFRECFSGDRGGEVLPACAGFDADADRDIDCSDYSTLAAAWSGPGQPSYPPCTLVPPTVRATGPRYLTITPPPGSLPVALLVTSEDWLCIQKYVDTTGFLVDDPVFLTPAQWGTVNVADPFIVPDATYLVQLDTGTDQSQPAAATTWKWGDTNNDGRLDDSDVVRVVDAFHGNYDTVPFQSVDLAACVPNRGVDLDDISAVVDAVAGQPYSAICPDPCNPEGGGWYINPDVPDSP